MQPLHVQWVGVSPHHPVDEQQVYPFGWFGSHWAGEPSFSGYMGPQRWSSRHGFLDGAIFISEWGSLELVNSVDCNGVYKCL